MKNLLLKARALFAVMASAVAVSWFRTRFKITTNLHDPDATGATVLSADGGTTETWIDMKAVERVCMRMTATVAGGSFTKFEIIANDESDGSGTTVVIKDSGTIAADAKNDTYTLECNASEVAQLGAAAGVNLRYLSARMTNATGTDEAMVTIIELHERQYKDLTPASQIA